MLKAHVIRLNPTQEQESYFWRCAGIARFTWNWALAELNAAYERGERPVIGSLKLRFNRLRKEEGFAPFVGEVQSYAYQQAFADLQKALSRYHDFRKRGLLKTPAGWKGRKDHKPFGWPRFKARNRSTPAFYLANNGGLRMDGHQVVIQRCPGGPVNMTEQLRFAGKVMGGRVRYRAGHWYLTVQVDVPVEKAPMRTGPAVGLDLGIKALCVTSDGVIYDNPKALARHQRKMRLLQRSLARRKRGGSNYKKTQAKIARLHERIGNIRKHALHQISHEVTRDYGLVGLEDLNVAGMLKNGKLARSISDVALGELRRQIGYKGEWRGSQVVAVSRWFPSSKTCNACGYVMASMPLSVRWWQCPTCGAEHDRDGNAAVNLRCEAEKMAGAAYAPVAVVITSRRKTPGDGVGSEPDEPGIHGPAGTWSDSERFQTAQHKGGRT